MASIPFAFSVHHFINSVGAYCGFAAFLGLAILALLYFAQARETATLREHAYEAAQRIQQLEARIAQLVRQPQAPVQAPQAQPAAGQRAPAAAPAQQRRPAAVPAGVAAAPVAVGAPAGVGAPALTAATKLIPTDVPGAPEPELDEEPDDYTRIGAPAGGRDPVPAAAVGTNGANHERIPPPAPAGVEAPPRVQLRPPAPAPSARRTPPPARTQPSSGGRIPRGFIFLLGGLAIVAVVAVLLIVTSSGGNSPASNAGRTTNAPAGAPRVKHVAAFNPSTVNVAVLNGTSTAGLANRIAVKLTGAGYKQGTVTNAADQTRTQTVVAYLPGHRNDALHVATSLNLRPSSVQQIDSSTQAVACPGGCGATTVVLTVGTDLASTP